MSEDNVVRGKLTRNPALDGQRPLPHIYVATPAYGGNLLAPYVLGIQALLRTLDRSGLPSQYRILWNESLITRARNRLVASFLETSCTHLFFIDADVGFTPRDCQPLIEADLDVVCGAYPMKSIGWRNVEEAVKAGVTAERLPVAGARYVFNATPKGANGEDIAVLERAGHRFIEVQDAATGFLLVKRAVIERYIAHYREAIEYVADYDEDNGKIHHMVFQADRDPSQLAAGQRARYLSEDYLFSRRLQLMGVPIWLCLGSKLSHTGTFTWQGDVETLVKLEGPGRPAPTGDELPTGT